MGTDTDRDRDDTGQYADRIPPERVLDAFDARDDRARPLTAGDVAEYLDIARRTAHNKLNRLTDREELKTRKVGAKGRVWWTPALADESRAKSGQEPAVTPSVDTADRTDPSSDAPRESPSTGEESAPLDDALAAFDTSADRRDAVRACVEYLREHRTAQKSGFVNDVYPEHPAGFGSAGGWWNKIGKQFLQAVAEDLDEIAAPAGEGSHTWRYIGEA